MVILIMTYTENISHPFMPESSVLVKDQITLFNTTKKVTTDTLNQNIVNVHKSIIRTHYTLVNQ